MHYAIYSRKSVSTGRGDSIENQVEMCRDYLHNYCRISSEDTVTVYEDEGFSGKDLCRPEFQKMLRAVNTGHIHCILCYRLDRISRSISDFAPLLEELNRKNVGFICIREKFDTTTPMGKAMIYIASVFAQLERETIAERVRDNMRMLAKTGRWLGGTPPTGFRAQTTETILLDGRKTTVLSLSVHPEERHIVLEIFHSFLQTHQISAVSHHLESLGIVSRTGSPFSHQGLRDILKNPVYCTCDRAAFSYFSLLGAEVCFRNQDSGYGILPYNRRSYHTPGQSRNPESLWILAKGHHPGFLPGGLWVTVQALLAPAKKHRPLIAPLTGRLFCGLCHRPMRAKRRSGREDYDYICTQKHRLGYDSCPSKNLPGALVEAAVFQKITEVFGPSPFPLPSLPPEARASLFLLLESAVWDSSTLWLTF